MTLKWFFAAVFMDELPWRTVYDVVGIYGTIIVYLLTVWGEVGIYAWMLYKILGRRSKYGIM